MSKLNTMSPRLLNSFILSGIVLSLIHAHLGAATTLTIAKPNVLVILVDDMGYGDPHCFNPESKIETPHIDQLASEGMRFTDAHAPGSTCVPSRYGLFTGRYPVRTWNIKKADKIIRNGHETMHFPLPMLKDEPQRLNLATLMKRNGYATACIGKWHQGMSSKADADGILPLSPINFGFDYYFGFDASEQPPYAFIENNRFVVSPTGMVEESLDPTVTNSATQGRHIRPGSAAPDWNFDAILPTIANKTDAWLNKHISKHKDQPFFLYYAIPAPHAPWLPGQTYAGKSAAGLYGDYVMAVDAVIGQALATLKQLHLKEQTLVLFSSDNGPVWYDKDISKFNHRASGQWKGMKGSLTEAGHRMPFIARWPGQVPATSTCDQMICFTDLIATLATMVGDTLPNDAGEDSFDIMPLLRGQTPSPPIRTRQIHVNYGSYTVALRDGKWKLILPAWQYAVADRTISPDQVIAPNDKKSKFELYNLQNDPSEMKNLAEENPTQVQALFAILKAEIERGRSRTSP